MDLTGDEAAAGVAAAADDNMPGTHRASNEVAEDAENYGIGDHESLGLDRNGCGHLLDFPNCTGQKLDIWVKRKSIWIEENEIGDPLDSHICAPLIGSGVAPATPDHTTPAA